MPDPPPCLDGVVVLTDPMTQAHDPGAEIWVGVATPAVEVPARVAAIRSALAGRGADLLPGDGLDDAVLAAVHTPELLAFLRAAAGRWAAGEYRRLVGQDRVVPYVFPTPAFLGDLPARVPVATHALTGVFCYDTMTLIGPGTWQAARAAADLAQTAVRYALDGRVAYALCRPPGHHATPGGYGGSCYLNNAAVAAQGFRAAGVGRVAVIDIDAHHGNGTQAVFYHRSDVWFGSVHVDPGAGWFPHFMGFADETGAADGRGWTRNIPLAPGAGDQAFVDGVGALAERAASVGVEALVVSLGVDAEGGDPESPLEVTPDGFAAAGTVLAELAGSGLPTVLVQEGGYRLDTLGALVARVLGPFASRR
ncbi:MAG: hypothetical protein WAL50_10175 [Kineosporiaceae bacterium]